MVSKFEISTSPNLLDSALRAIAWIERAQSADSSGGVPAFYVPLRGWAPPYPETTGYIIPTFLALDDLLDRPQLGERAILMGDWLLRIQHPDGAFPGSVWVAGKRAKESIFNSGQILFGLIALWKATKDTRWKDAGLRCAHWLLSNQDSDGAWRRFAYRDTFHVYKTRVAWALGLAGKHWEDSQLVDASIRNVENALGFQDQSGWFEHASFDAGAAPVLHTFAYTVQGVLETGILFQRQDFVDRAVLSSNSLSQCQSEDGSLPGRVERDFSSVGFRCLTGIAQQVIIWSRLHQVGIQGGHWQLNSAAALNYLQSVQVSNPGHINDGGLAGSSPLWGPYMRFRYPNWAAKFYLDAVITHAGLMDEEAWG